MALLTNGCRGPRKQYLLMAWQVNKIFRNMDETLCLGLSSSVATEGGMAVWLNHSNINGASTVQTTWQEASYFYLLLLLFVFLQDKTVHYTYWKLCASS